MFNVSGIRQKILPETSYSLPVALSEILPSDSYMGTYYNSDTLEKGNL